MKKAEDFRKAFGPATPGFETVVKKTIKELRAQEIKPVVKEWRRWRRPVFAMAMALVLFVGFVAVSGTLNPFNRQDRIRSEEENLYTAQPITTVLSMGAGQEEGDGDGAESGTSEGGMYSAANIDESVQRSLMWFFETWVQDPERVKMGCTPEWRESTDREEVLQAILADRTPLSYQINSISGQDGDPVRDAVCTLEMEKGRFERFTIALVKDEYESYDIDPEGLKSGDPVEADSFTKTVAMSEEGFISARLDLEVPGLSDKLFPVNLVCEKNGLRVEVISGYVSGTECQFVISMEDLEGKYDDSMVFPTFACDMAGFSGYSAGTVYTDKKKHKTVYLYTPNLSNPDLTEDRIITAGIDTVHMETLKDIDLLPMLGQYGKTVEGVKQPSQLKLAGTANKFPPKDMKFLDYTQPLDIPLFGDVCLSGIGWIDGQLHVQYHNTGAVSYSKGSVTYNNTWSVWEYGTAGMPAYSPVEWDVDLDGYGEWEEFIYDLSPEETDGLELGATIKLLDKVLNDGWMVEIPLELICPDVLKMDPEIEERLDGFMNRWSTQDYDGMLTLCDPEWRANTEDARQALEELTQSATLLGNRYKKITGTAEDTLRTVTCATNIQRPGNKLHTSFQLDIEVKKAADGLWYINPESLRIWTVTEDIRVEPVDSADMDDQEMFPINLSSEDNGFRMEVISGKVSGKEASFKITLEDLEGKYADYTWSQNFEVEIPDVYGPSCSSYPLNGSETEHRITYQHTQEFTEPVRNGEQTVTVKAPNIRLEEEAEINLIPLLREHGKTEDGVRMPRLLSSYPDQSELPKDLKVLDYNKPLDIPLFKDVKLSGIGWIDDQLHIQFHNTGRCGVTEGDSWYNAWCTWIDGLDWTEIGHSEMDWDENSDSFPEWTEYVINVRPEEAENLELVARITVLKEILTGSWQVEVPLNQIWAESDEEELVETAEAEEPVQLDRKEDYNQMLLWQFFEYWAQDDVENMVYSLSPEYQNRGQETVAQLRELVASGTPLSYQINSRIKLDGGFVYVCTVEMDPGNGEEPRYERFDFLMTKDKTGFDSGMELASVKERRSVEKDPALETVSLTREAIINDYLDYFDPGVREQLQPIGMSCEKNGLRMELISGLVDFSEEWILYSLEDVDGKYDNYQLDTFSLEDSTGTWQTFSSAPIYRDKAEHKVYFIWNPHYGRPVDTTARDITLRLNCVDSSLKTWANMTELLEQYGESVEGIPVPEETQDSESGKKADHKVLDYHKPLDIQLLPNAAITGIGWIDDQLHVQICINGLKSNSFIFSETVEGEGWTGTNREVSYSPLRWFEDGNEYMEYVFDYKPGDEKTITLNLDTTIAQEIITGPWEFRFQLGMICPDVKEAEPAAE